jgi:hypothetical protein
MPEKFDLLIAQPNLSANNFDFNVDIPSFLAGASLIISLEIISDRKSL